MFQERNIKMKNLIIDSRMRDEEYTYLSNYFNIFKLPLSDDVYEEISGHSDIFYCKINNRIIAAPNAKILEDGFKLGKTKVGKKYPLDVLYNACQIGNTIIGSKYLDESIIPDIVVKQGYVKCSIAVTSDKSCITTDKKIAEVLNKNNIDALHIEENNIKLLKKDKSISKMHGFIGGASLIFDNKFVLFGDINMLKNKDKVLEHINKYNLELVYFKGLDIYDYGGGIVF